MGYCFGIDIGGTTVKIGLAAEDGTLLEGWEIPTRREPTPEGLLLDIRVSILDRLDRGLDRGKKQKIRRADILGIGMAAPGRPDTCAVGCFAQCRQTGIIPNADG